MAVTDTDSRALAIQTEGFRRMPPEARLRMAARMSVDVRELTRAGIQHRHPEYSAAEVEDALRALLVGAEKFRKIFPGRPLLAP